MREDIGRIRLDVLVSRAALLRLAGGDALPVEVGALRGDEIPAHGLRRRILPEADEALGGKGEEAVGLLAGIDRETGGGIGLRRRLEADGNEVGPGFVLQADVDAEVFLREGGIGPGEGGLPDRFHFETDGGGGKEVGHRLLGGGRYGNAPEG